MTTLRPLQRLALCSLCLFCLSAPAKVRDQDAPVFNPAQVPAKGRKAEDFLPRGWELGTRAEGDLNSDQVPDHVVQLVPEGHEAAGIGSAPENHVLLILLSSEGVGLRRAGLATRLLVPFVPQYGLELTIKNGVFVVNQNYGMTDVTDLTHRFRYDDASGRFLLIGKDTYSYHRPQGPEWPSTRVNENYLTGVSLTTTERWLRNGTSRATTVRGRASRARVFLEDVDEDPDN